MIVTAGSAVAVVGAAACLVLALLTVPTRRPPRGPALAAVASLVLGAVVACGPAGPRWQLLPVVLGGALATLVVRLGRRRAPSVVVALAAALAIAAGTGAVWAFPPLRLPVPTGPHPVGTTELQWQGPTLRGQHTIVAQVWYPAASAAGGAGRYAGRDGAEAREVTGALARTFGAPRFLLHDVEVARARAVPEAAVAPGGFPVVLFSPGDVSVRRQNTAWATELAAHGYVVVALDHPFDSAVQVAADGVATGSLVRSSGDDAQDQAQADEQVRVRARQFGSALDELARRHGGGGLLAGHLDLTRVAATGHSLGGATALRAAADDPRVDAAIDLDGLPRTRARPTVPVMVLVAGRGTQNTANDRRYAAAVRDAVAESPDARVVTVDGASHLTFTDAPLFLPPLPALVGTLGRAGAVHATTEPTLEFLHEALG
ncbi:alpha/beta hydrolase family protein [Kineococcus rhizosphaerae]|uniref:Platelet-activating factor acetylhydrolase isoform II n=1 Tax=Kineococcus rhizosphaerae TaxID=559628 RepID=A0A2T0RAI1_9ACTN|nr:hypothetical protein [Kineococcus rhizosphaerae]PRY18140.1 platelet-activating factor acetylhydrolase isoform II [Kineococcus rhizosphaerae]